MKILFLTYHGFDPASGISKKMLAQIKGLRQNGHEVHVCSYDYAPSGHLCRFVDDEVIKDYGTGLRAALMQRMSYGCILGYCRTHAIELVYARSYMNATPPLVRLFRSLRKAGVRSVMEIPTYPYDQEFEGFDWNQRLRLRVDKLFRRQLAAQMDAVVTFSDEETIFGQRTIRISNGVDMDAIPLLAEHHDISSEVHLIAVAEVHSWHGFDRLIHGLGEYYRNENQDVQSPKRPKRKVFFHLVGDVWPSEMDGSSKAPGFAPYIREYGIGEYVKFHGKLFGEDLDAVFRQCDFAVGSLGRHRSGITVIKTLKNREYACRGIPFIYSEQDSDFDHQPYVLKAPADESPVDINRILSFLDSLTITPEEIRRSVEHLSWKRQMQRVIDSAVANSTLYTLNSKLKIVYCTPSLHIAGGVERVLTLKANYFAEHFSYDITIILTDGLGKPNAYPLSEKVKVVNLNIGFEELWSCSFVKKVFVYLKKQRRFRKVLTNELMRLRPDITVSMLRREINFINDIKDGSKKVGEMHINRANYRNFDSQGAGWFRRLFASVWSHNLIGHLKRLDKMVVLTEKDAEAWTELENVTVIPNPLDIMSATVSVLTERRVLAVARYSHEKGIDLLLKAWAIVEKQIKDWRLDVYGDGDRKTFEQIIDTLGIDRTRCELHGRTDDVEKEYKASSVFVLSSRFEGFGMVIAEAMACGLPVVSFDCPWGPRHIIKDGVDGLLAENGNTDDLAACLLRLMGDEQLRQSMSQAGMKNIRRFDIQHVAERWRILFESL